MELTDEQSELVNRITDWFYDKSASQIFEYTGGAGTGKSVVMTEAIRSIGLQEWQVAPAAYTGTAALVLCSKGLINAKTIHSWIFKPKLVPDHTQYDAYLNRYRMKLVFMDKDLPIEVKLMCIDEASFVPLSLKEKLLSKGVKILACGDLNQLPPVMEAPAFLTNPDFRLTKIMRQNESSGIVTLSNRILNGETIKPGTYGNVDVIKESDLTDDILLNADIVLCGKNTTRYSLNKHIRKLNGIDPYRKLPIHGEKMICRKNNWTYSIDGISLANGLTGIVSNFPSISSLSRDKSYFKMDFKPFAFDKVFRNLKCNYEYFTASKEKRDILKNSKRASHEWFELGYCITTHLSQGSQYRDGVYISEYLNRDIQRNLDYTGITRFSDHCTFVIK